jgi:TRAP-type C4-dicarboxylate transport system permease small subunit
LKSFLRMLFVGFDWYYRLLLVLAAIAMVATFVLVILGIFARELGWNISGLDGYAGYAIAAILFLALPATLKQGDHIRVMMALERLPKRVASLFEIGCLLVAVAISTYIAFYAGRLVWVSYITHDVAQTMDATKLWIPQLSLALGCIGFALAFIQALLSRLIDQPFFVQSGEVARSE